MLKEGKIVCQGQPRMVMTPSAIREVFGIECCIIRHPLGDVPVCLPNGFCAMQDPARRAGGQPVASDPDPPPSPAR